jgi:hypothetical protein
MQVGGRGAWGGGAELSTDSLPPALLAAAVRCVIKPSSKCLDAARVGRGARGRRHAPCAPRPAPRAPER